jgi:hypothetical protein
MEEAQNAVIITAVNGDVSIVATNGKIRLQGTDIELTAVGEGQTKGNIKLEATENVIVESKKVLVTAKTMYKLCTPGDAAVTPLITFPYNSNVPLATTSASPGVHNLYMVFAVTRTFLDIPLGSGPYTNFILPLV